MVLWLSYLPLDPRFAGSNPAGVDGFFQNIKILSMTSFRREVKPWVPCCRFTARKRTTNWNWSLWAKFFCVSFRARIIILIMDFIIKLFWPQWFFKIKSVYLKNDYGQNNLLIVKSISKIIIVDPGGPVVIILATGSEVGGFKPGRSRWIFSEHQNPEYDFLQKGSKAVSPVS